MDSAGRRKRRALRFQGLVWPEEVDMHPPASGFLTRKDKTR
jgi:hypothetical protein